VLNSLFIVPAFAKATRVGVALPGHKFPCSIRVLVLLGLGVPAPKKFCVFICLFAETVINLTQEPGAGPPAWEEPSYLGHAAVNAARNVGYAVPLKYQTPFMRFMRFTSFLFRWPGVESARSGGIISGFPLLTLLLYYL